MDGKNLESRDYRHGEALRILGRLSERKVRLGEFLLVDAILLLHIFRAGEIRTPTTDQLKQLKEIERKLFG